MEGKNRKRFRIKKIFSSLLLSYAALLMVPLLIVFVLMEIWNASMERYYKELANNSLSEGRMAFEKRLGVLQTGAFAMVNDSELSWVSYLEGLNPGDSNISMLIRCNKKLNEVFADTDKYYDYCVILRNGFVFRKKGMYVGREFFYNTYRKYEKMSYEEWMEQSFRADTWKLFPMQDITVDNVTERAITYSFPVRSSFKQTGEAKAAVQFLVPERAMEEMFAALREMQGTVCLYDKEGSLLAKLYSPKLLEEEEIAQAEWPKPGDWISLNIGGEEKLVLHQYSENEALHYIVILPSETVLMNQKQTRAIASAALALGILFEVLLGVRFAFRYSVPIRNIVENIQRMFYGGIPEEGTHKTLSEYEFLKEGVNTLISDNESMKTVLQEKSAREKVNFLTLLFNGEFHGDEEIAKEARYAGVDLTAPGHYIIVLQTEEGLETLFKMLQDRKLSSVKESYMTDSGKIALLIADNEPGAEGESEERRQIRKILEERVFGEVYIGIGQTYTQSSDLVFSFRQACYCADKAQRKNCWEGIEYGKALLELNMPAYSLETEERLLNAVKYGDRKLVAEIFRILRQENLEEAHLPRTMEKLLISDITATLLNLCNSMAEGETAVKVMERTESAKNLEQGFDLLEECFLELSGRVSALRDRRAEEYLERLRAYILEKYGDPQFGMSAAAEAFSLSESYFSTFFKEIMGRSFSSYLENVRLEKAKELIAEGRYDLEKISGMVGYSSSATFRRAFKRACGVAPSVWKKE